MPTLVIESRVTGTADQADRRAALLQIGTENAARAAANPPLAPLPTADAAQLRASYEIVLTKMLTANHLDSVKQADVATIQDLRSLWDAATDNQRNAARTALGG